MSGRLQRANDLVRRLFPRVEPDPSIPAPEMCGARAAYCVCPGLAHPGQPHVCCCGGSWYGDMDGDDFKVVTLPPQQFDRWADR